MTVSHVSSLTFCAAVALLVLTPFAQPRQAAAQSNSSAPVRLAPPQKLRPAGQPVVQTPATVVAPAPAPAPAQVVPAGQANPVSGAIQVDTLQTINPDTAGVLNGREGGFGVDMWAGTSRRMLEAQIVRLPVNNRSQVMRDLIRRLLLSTATLPAGMAGDGNYIARRVGLLAAMGDTLSVSRLLEATPGRSQINQLMRFEADVRFLANDNSRACSLAAGQIGAQASVYWQKAFIFCQALAGEHDKASLGVSLLQETGDNDNAFYSLVEALGGHALEIKSLPDPSPMHLSMARVSKSQLPADVVSSARPGVLRTIAKSPNASVEIRLEAAERAEMAGALDVDILRQLYTSVSFSKEDMTNPLTKAEAESGPMSRALLYRTALIQTVPIAQAEAAAKALSLGREGGRYTSIVRVFLPVLSRIAPSTELVWFAPEILRAFLISGEFAAATPWFALLQANAQHNAEAAHALDALMPLARIAGSPEAAQWGPAQLANWWKRLSEDDDARDKAALLYTLFDALGDDVPQDAWDALLGGPQQITLAMPNPALWRGLKEATKAASQPMPAIAQLPTEAPLFGAAASQVTSVTQVSLEPQTATTAHLRVGEVVLLSMIALGEGGPGQAGTIVLSQVMHSLGVVGLEKEVRAIALEAAVAAGL